jgi:hypothetical protein
MIMTALPSALSEGNLERRAEIAQKFVPGELGVEFKGFEAGQAPDKYRGTEHV